MDDKKIVYESTNEEIQKFVSDIHFRVSRLEKESLESRLAKLSDKADQAQPGNRTLLLHIFRVQFDRFGRRRRVFRKVIIEIYVANSRRVIFQAGMFDGPFLKQRLDRKIKRFVDKARILLNASIDPLP